MTVPLFSSRVAPDWRERYARYLEPIPESGCWIWTGALTTRGYGSVRVANGTARAHRATYEMALGPIPTGLELDHLCRVPTCVNPDHLEPVTHTENVRRGNSGINMRIKTQCPQGHAYSPENTYIRPSDQARCCRACARKASALYKRAKRMAA